MLALMFAVVLCGQTPEFVKGYKPQVGDRVILARDEPGRRVPIVKNAGAAMSFWGIIDGDDEFNYEAVVNGDELTEIEAGTPAQLMDVTNTRTPIFMVHILGGPRRGQTTFTYAPSAASSIPRPRRRPQPHGRNAVLSTRKQSPRT